jgi:hypothetical protein
MSYESTERLSAKLAIDLADDFNLPAAAIEQIRLQIRALEDELAEVRSELSNCSDDLMFTNVQLQLYQYDEGCSGD